MSRDKKMHHDNRSRFAGVLLALGITGLTAGCATLTTPDRENHDPLEGGNRVVYTINDYLDKYVLEPVAKRYVQYTPSPVRTAVTHFFDNVMYLNVVFNDLLQGKIKQGLADLGRFTLNSTLGIGGLFDPATAWGVPKHEEDLGQTLGVWGMGEGAYLYLPLSGPNSLRDAPNLVTSTLLNPLFYISSPVMIPVGLLGGINTRANHLDATRMRDEAALDPYTFTREAYREKRLSLMYDGELPTEHYGELIDDSEEEAVLEIE
jgi:phospholipid-binding lipoprotein MlaA